MNNNHEDNESLGLKAMVRMYRDMAGQEPSRRHRTTIYRTAKRVVQEAEGSSAGVYWTAEQIAAWHPEDFHKLCEQIGAEDVQGMELRGEMCFHCTA